MAFYPWFALTISLDNILHKYNVSMRAGDNTVSARAQPLCICAPRSLQNP